MPVRLKENEEGEIKLRIRLALNIKARLCANSPTSIDIFHDCRGQVQSGLRLVEWKVLPKSGEVEGELRR